MYGKTMSLPDRMIIPYIENVTDVPDDELAQMRRAMDEASVNPMELKKRLARELVAQFHDAAAASEAEVYFERTVQRGETPEDIATFVLPSASELAQKRLSDILIDAKLTVSSSDARRLINQDAVKVNDETISTNVAATVLAVGDIVQVGRRRLVKIVAPHLP